MQEIHWYTHNKRREKRRKIWVQARPSYINNISGTSIYNPYGKRERLRDMQDTDIWRPGKAQSDQWGRHRQRPSPDKQRPSPGGQRPSPARAPTRTSRRAGISQGDLPHTRDTTSVSRMHGNYKEQYGSHSLNRWKERLALLHRHAGMSTGSEPYTLRGILSKGPRALMTMLGPSHDEGPGTQPHKIVSEVSVRIHYKNEFYQ